MILKMLFFFAAVSFPAWFLLSAGLGTRRDSRRRSERERRRATGVIVGYVRGRVRSGKSGGLEAPLETPEMPEDDDEALDDEEFELDE